MGGLFSNFELFRTDLTEMPRAGRITCQNPKADADEPPKCFTFDAVFAPSITQRKLYDVCSAPVVASVLEGFNGTIFAYGQTGAGKTFTMEGVQDPPELRGIIPNAFQQIFDRVALAAEGVQFLVRASYLEIYNEEVRGLLAKDPKNRLDLKENVDSGVYVKDLTSFIVKSSHEIDQVMQAGKKNRSVGATAMNAGSSRSHAIFTIIVECCDSTGTVRTGEHITVGKLNLVDLAGSERQSKTQATGDRLKEATKINLSLSALGNVISALVDGKSQHIPYRDSKLTRLLQDSLGGNTKTVMCANCGPAVRDSAWKGASIWHVRHRRASTPSSDEVGGLIFDFEPVRTASGPRRWRLDETAMPRRRRRDHERLRSRAGLQLRRDRVHTTIRE